MADTTLKQISQVLGISVSTVSRALKDHPDISTHTKRKVIELAETLEYEPNVTAVNLRNRKTRAFGVIVPSVTNAFYDSFIAAIEEESRKVGYSLLILQNHEEQQAELDNLRLCRQNRVSGVFACYNEETHNLEAYDRLHSADIPLVFFDKVPESDRYNKVCLADSEAAAMAAGLLLQKNKRHVLALFGHAGLSITKHRLAAFTAQFAGHSNVQLTVEHTRSTETAEAMAARYLQQAASPDAVFCMSDEILMGVMKTVQRLQLRIPRELGIIALSNGGIPQLYYPEITYVETSGHALGKQAFLRMLRCIGGEKESSQEMVQSRLVEGGSL